MQRLTASLFGAILAYGDFWDYLSCRCVCKSWNDIVRRVFESWTSLDLLTLPDSVFGPKATSTNSSVSKLVRNVVSHKTLDKLLSFTKNLTELRLSEAFLTLLDEEGVMLSKLRIRKLSFVNCLVDRPMCTVTSEDYTYLIPPNHPTLRTLEFVGCSFSKSYIGVVSSHFLRLKIAQRQRKKMAARAPPPPSPIMRPNGGSAPQGFPMGFPQGYPMGFPPQGFPGGFPNQMGMFMPPKMPFPMQFNPGMPGMPMFPFSPNFPMGPGMMNPNMMNMSPLLVPVQRDDRPSEPSPPPTPPLNLRDDSDSDTDEEEDLSKKTSQMKEPPNLNLVFKFCDMSRELEEILEKYLRNFKMTPNTHYVPTNPEEQIRVFLTIAPFPWQALDLHLIQESEYPTEALRDLTKAALDSGLVTIETTNSRGNTPLISAIVGRELDEHMLSFVMSRGPDINGRNSKTGVTPLMVAAQSGNMKMFDFILRSGGDKEVLDFDGRNLFSHAVAGGNLYIVSWVLSQAGGHAIHQITHLDYLGRSYLSYTRDEEQTQSISEKVVEALGGIANVLTISLSQQKRWTFIHEAAKLSGPALFFKQAMALDEETQMKIVNQKDVFGRTPLHYCVVAEKSSVTVLQNLISMGVDVNAADVDGNTALHLLVRDSDLTLLKPLLQGFGGKGEVNLSILNNKMESAFSVLVSRPAFTKESSNLVMESCYDLTETNNDLLNLPDSKGDTPLMIATEAKSETVALFLLGLEGVNAQAVNHAGFNLLHKAAGSSSLRLVNKLMAKKFDVNTVVTSTGDTPLHLACQHITGPVDLEIIDALMKPKDVNVTHQNNQGKTAYDIYMENSKWLIPLGKHDLGATHQRIQRKFQRLMEPQGPKEPKLKKGPASQYHNSNSTQSKNLKRKQTPAQLEAENRMLQARVNILMEEIQKLKQENEHLQNLPAMLESGAHGDQNPDQLFNL
eukprot:TRINITY_DN6459_c0_g1_i1.p1 TRINITY_DN6459_c0_g1~~TRINITY_DN6459_c0_g1_i1.p1  ORF type:complete len:954 (+),score=247.90 TRINITY_DN6459_c0_g1_i1:105-2966(+)